MKTNSKVLFAGFFILFSAFTFSVLAQKQHFIQLKNVGELQQLLHYTKDRIPLISAHRGGPEPGFPENSLETFNHTLGFLPALIECDVQLTKDSSLVMMHDNSLDRTSNKTGKIIDQSLADLKGTLLKDNNGKLTDFKMPTFEDVLKWAKNKTVLTVDVKKDVPNELIVKVIQKYKAQSYAIVIAYSIDNALKYYKMDSTLCFSVNVANQQDLERLDKSGLPYKNIFAFVGISEPDLSIYEELHKRGILCMIGTMGNLDKKASARQNNVYEQLIKNGADMLSTDFPQEAKTALVGVTPESGSKQKFFK